MARLWSENEIEILKKEYLYLSDSELGKLLNRSKNSVERKRNSLGLIKNKKPNVIDKSIVDEILNSKMSIADANRAFGAKYNLTYNQIRYIYNSNNITFKAAEWSLDEIDYLKKNTHLTPREISTYLNRSENAIAKKARALNLSLARISPTKEDSWSNEDIKYLREHYHNTSIEKIAKKLNRTEKAVQVKAARMSLYSRSRMWSELEDDILKANSHMSLSELSFILERTEKSIKHRALALNVRIGTRIRSKIEVIVESILKKHDIEYLKDVRPLRDIGYEADFLFSNIIIEVQGDYWHCNPNIFPIPSDKQKGFIAKDKLKKKIFESAGYKVFYIWEDDVINRINQVEEQIALIIRDNNTRGSKPIFGGVCDKHMLTTEALKC